MLPSKSVGASNLVGSGGTSHYSRTPNSLGGLKPKERFTSMSKGLLGSLVREIKNSHVEIPEKLLIVYYDDYNIISLHSIVEKKLELLQERLPRMDNGIKKLQAQLSMRQTILDREATLKALRSKQAKRDDISSRKKLLSYLQESRQYLEAYCKLGPKRIKPKKFNLVGQQASHVSAEPVDEERVQIVTEYLRMCKRYVNLEYMRNIPSSSACEYCGFEGIESRGGMQTCMGCYATRPVLIQTGNKASIADNGVKPDYDDRENFYKTLVRYQCKQTNLIPQALYTSLDNYFSVRGLPIGAAIKGLPLNARGKRGNTDLQSLFKALQEIGYTDYYEDANLIAHTYCGWLAPDISHIEEIIMSDYDKTQEVFNNMEKERKSSLGTQYRAYKHLQLRGHPCLLEDFKMATIRESLETHELLWSRMCAGCEDPEIYYIPS